MKESADEMGQVKICLGARYREQMPRSASTLVHLAPDAETNAQFGQQLVHSVLIKAFALCLQKCWILLSKHSRAPDDKKLNCPGKSVAK